MDQFWTQNLAKNLEGTDLQILERDSLDDPQKPPYFDLILSHFWGHFWGPGEGPGEGSDLGPLRGSKIGSRRVLDRRNLTFWPFLVRRGRVMRWFSSHFLTFHFQALKIGEI